MSVETNPVEPVVAPTPAVAPVAATVVEPAPTITPVEPTPVEVPVGDTKADQVANFVTDLGYDTNEIDRFVDANGKLPDEVIKELTEKHGEAVAKLIEDNVTTLVEQDKTNAEAERKAVYDNVEKAFEGITEQSGEETWKELQGWATVNLAEQKEEINGLLAEGGLAAELALTHIITAFKASDAFTQPAELITGDQSAGTQASEVVTKEIYANKLRELMDSGKSYESKEVTRLQAQRNKAMRRGQ